MEETEIRVGRHHRLGRPTTVVRRVHLVQPRGVQAVSHIDGVAPPPATDRRLRDHIVRAAHTQVGGAHRLPAGHRDPIAGRVGHRQVRFRLAGVCAVFARGPKTASGVLVHGHGPVVHPGGGHPARPRRVRRPVGPVRRHVVHVQQFRRRACVPVDVDMRTAAHARPSGRQLHDGVVRLPDHVHHAQGVPVRFGRSLRAERVLRVRRRVRVNGRIRALRRARDVGQEFSRNRGLLHGTQYKDHSKQYDNIRLLRNYIIIHFQSPVFGELLKPLHSSYRRF